MLRKEQKGESSSLTSSNLKILDEIFVVTFRTDSIESVIRLQEIAVGEVKVCLQISEKNS